MVLPFLVFAQIAATCAPGVAPETLAALAGTESGFNPNAIHDNTANRSYFPPDQAEAIRTATPLLAAGHSVDLGIMQINSRNFTWVGLTVESAFDPCESIRAGATVLTGFSKYNTGSPTRGFSNGYVQRVLSRGRQLPIVPAVQKDTPSQESQQASPPRPTPRKWLAGEESEDVSQDKPWLITTR